MQAVVVILQQQEREMTEHEVVMQAHSVALTTARQKPVKKIQAVELVQLLVL